jgi:hypothetical protein
LTTVFVVAFSYVSQKNFTFRPQKGNWVNGSLV